MNKKKPRRPHEKMVANGAKGGSALRDSRGPDYFRELAAKRVNRRGGRPRKVQPVSDGQK